MEGSDVVARGGGYRVGVVGGVGVRAAVGACAGREDLVTGRVVVRCEDPAAAPVVHVRGGAPAEGVADHGVEWGLREVDLESGLRPVGLQCLHLLRHHDRPRCVLELEARLLSARDLGAALTGSRAWVAACAHTARVDRPAVVLQQLGGSADVKRVRVALLECVGKVVRRFDWHGAVVGICKTLEEVLDVAGLVDQVLHGLPHVQLLVEGSVGRVGEVDLEVRDLPADPGRKRVLRERVPLIDVLDRDVAVVHPTRVDDVEFGGVGGVGLLVELGEGRLYRARIAWVRNHGHVAVGGHRLQLPRTADDLPQRVVVVGADRLGLTVQILVDCGGLGGVAVVVADSLAVRGLVPDMLRKRRDLAQLVKGEEERAICLVQREDDCLRVGERHGRHVVRKLARRVCGPVGDVGLQQVHPELDVAGRDRLAVGPLPALELHGHGLAAICVNGVAGQAQARVELHLAVLTEPVQRPVHEELELAQVGDAEEPARGEREDVVRLGVGSLGKRGGAAAQFLLG